MRVLVTGGAGFLGRALLAGAPAAVEVHATQRRTPAPTARSHTVELSDHDQVARLLEGLRPDVVVHTAYGKHDGERDIVAATRAVAETCALHGAGLVHISSDAVFDGRQAPYAEDAPLSPVHEYGRWKAAAEACVRRLVPEAAIVRTSLIMSADPPDAVTRWMAAAIRSGHADLFVDELRSPIAAVDLVAQLWELVDLPPAERAGFWHLVGPETVSRYSLGLLLANRLGLDTAGIVPASQADHPEPRPADLRLSTARADTTLRSRPRPISQYLAFDARGTPDRGSPPTSGTGGRRPPRR